MEDAFNRFRVLDQFDKSITFQAENVIFVYPGPEGLHVGRSQIKAVLERDFSRFLSATIDYTSISVGSRNDVAWFASEWVATVDLGDRKRTIPARWTAVLERQNGNWLFVQSHFTYEPVKPKESG